MEVLGGVMVPMRDGAKLATDLFLPQGPGPFPAILTRTPYTAMLDGISQGANKLGLEIARDFTTQGYVLVWQDCRGTGRSKGNWDPYIHEGKDGLDLVKWVRGQSWSNGKVTMFGGSYCGFTQLAAATQAGKSLCAILPEVPVFNWYDINYTGGAFRLDSTIFWSTLMVRPRFGEHSPHESGHFPFSLEIFADGWPGVVPVFPSSAFGLLG
jgi:putative CocE/NonD family hydrolase